MINRLLIAILLFVAPCCALAADYTVCSSGCDYTQSTFEALSGTGYAGDTFYFSGTFGSQLDVGISGTSGNPVTLDGYQSGDANPGVTSTATIDRDGGTNGMVLSDQSYLVVQDFTLTDSTEGIISYGNNNTITYKRNYIYEIDRRGIFHLGSTSGYLIGSAQNITIGGASGDGNVIKNIGTTTAGGDIELSSTVNGAVVSYNTLYADDTDWGIDGVICYRSKNVLIEFNTIHGHNRDSNGENAVDLKWVDGAIVRFNDIYNHQEGAGAIVLHYDATNINIYNNRIWNSTNAGILLMDGVDLSGSPDRGNSVSNVRIWSNLIYDGDSYGIWVAACCDSGYDHVDSVKIYNNVIDNFSTAGIYINSGISGSGHDIKNNIFSNNTSYDVYTTDSDYLDGLDYNHYDSPSIRIESTTYTSLGSLPGTYEDNGSTGDPLFTDEVSNDYTLSENSPCIDAGDDLSGLVDSLSILGAIYNVYWEDALHPDTNWTTMSIVTAKQTDHDDFDQGAYISITGGVNNAPVCTIDTPSNPYAVNASTEWAQGITATCTDADGDSLTYSWSISTNAIAAWDSGRTYSVGHLVLHSGIYYKATSGSTNVSPPNPSYWDDYADQLEDPGEPWSGASAGSYNFILTANDGTDDSTPVILVEVIGEPDPPVITYQSTTLSDGAYNDDDGNITAISTHFTESVTVTSVPQQIVFLSNNSTAYPNDISHANWVKTRATVASGQKAFEEGTTLSSCGAIVASVDDNNHNIRSEYVAATEGDTYVMDVWLSEGALDWARILLGQYESDYTWSSGHYCDVDIANKTVGTCSSGVYGAYYGEDSDGWVHFAIMATVTDATPDVAYVSAAIFPAEADTDITFIGDDSSNYTYVCGAEIYKRIAFLDYSSGSPGADLVWANHTIADGDNIDRLDLGPIYFEGTDAIEATDDSTPIDQSVIYGNSLRGLHNIKFDTTHPTFIGWSASCSGCTTDGTYTTTGTITIEGDWNENLECQGQPDFVSIDTVGLWPNNVTLTYIGQNPSDNSKLQFEMTTDIRYRTTDLDTATSLGGNGSCYDAAGNEMLASIDSFADSAAIVLEIPGIFPIGSGDGDYNATIAGFENNIGIVNNDIIVYKGSGEDANITEDNVNVYFYGDQSGYTWNFTGSGCKAFDTLKSGITVNGTTKVERARKRKLRKKN